MRILAYLDRRAFLGFDLWEFSFLSFFRQYGWVFLSRVVIKHPVRTIRGFLKYRKWRRGLADEGEILFLSPKDSLPKVGKGWLVGLGFCLKPLGSCPSGRFNHDCALIFSGKGARACQDCQIGLIGRRALASGASVYIMTSAKDVVYDMFLPMIEEGKYQWVMLFLCPYTSKVMAFPLLICGVSGLIVKYSSGDCKGYREFSRADRGDKPEQTAISQAVEEGINKFYLT